MRVPVALFCACVGCLFPSLGDLAPPANRAGSALSTRGGCAHASKALSLSASPFSVELWLRVDSASAGTELDPIVWNGGRTTSEGGWSINLQGSSIVFCVSDAGSGKCTPAYAVTPGDLVHVVCTAALVGQRTLDVYVRDVTRGDATHALVAEMAGANVDWTSTAVLTVGGAFAAGQCTTPAHVTVDDVRVFGDVLTPSTMDDTQYARAAPRRFQLRRGCGHLRGRLLAVGASARARRHNTIFVPSPFP